MANVVNEINDKSYAILDKTLGFLQNNFNTINRGKLPDNLIKSYGKIEALNQDLTKLSFPVLTNVIDEAIVWLREYKLTKGMDSPIARPNLFAIAETILFQAQLYCPVLSGALRDSGYVEITDGVIRVGFSSPYAVYVHENLAVKHPIHAHDRNCGGKAKFLEIAATEILQRAVSIKVDNVSEGIYIEVR